jgi:hypothetical protein
MHHEEEAPRARRREAGTHQIETPRILPDLEDLAPYVTQHHEERRARGVRDPEHSGGGDEFARVPQRDGGRERDDVADEDQDGDGDGRPVRRPFR